MRIALISRFSISMVMILLTWSLMAQEEERQQDSIVFKQKYGLRIGGDLSKILRTALDEDYTGFEINGDFRLSQNLYVAGELGTEEKTTSTDFLQSTASGSYLKGGVDYNMYQNWFGMENMIFAGFRAGFSTFSQTVDNYTVFNTDQTFPQTTVTESREFKGLSAIWAEIMIGIKVETLDNLYVGINAQLKGLITDKQPENFENIYIPGFNRTYDSGAFGVGFGYNISYLIPIFKKEN